VKISSKTLFSKLQLLRMSVQAARRVQRSQPWALHPTRHPSQEGSPPTPQELLRPERIGTRDFPKCLRKDHVQELNTRKRSVAHGA